MDSAAVTVTLSASPRETIYATDQLATRLEELALTLGEGPCEDASSSTGSPVLAADLSSPDCLTRWPVFAPAAVHAGARAVFALPLRIGAIRLGVLGLYRAHPGGLDRQQLADVLTLTRTACAVLLDTAEHDREFRAGRWLQHAEVHQATGMITVQLGVSAAVALARLRAYAYAHGRPLHDVAADVVVRRLRFEPDAAGPGGPGR